MENSFEEGRLLLIDKPVGWTSFDVVKKLRNVLRVKKIGHAGTLDPLATGLLLIGTGKYTKKLNELQGLDKTYSGVFEIGKTTPSYDLETAFENEKDWSHITAQALSLAKEELTGEIQQVPPAYSAVKVGGERAYKRARANKKVVIKPKNVKIQQFDITNHTLPDVGFTVACSKGTYIRTLAHDFGQKLGVGAYLKKLVRTSVGDYQLENATTLEDFIKRCHEGN